MINIVHGNLFDYIFKHDVVIHGCNTLHIMNAGIAKQLRLAYPEIFEADRLAYEHGAAILGNYSTAITIFGTMIVNLYTQECISRSKRCLDYDALRTGLELVNEQVYSGATFLMPQIGAGLAGGKWSTILNIIADTLNSRNVTIVVFDK